jgi:hypothetical protein
LIYVDAELARHCGLPEQDALVPEVVADARAAIDLAGLAAGPHGEFVRRERSRRRRGSPHMARIGSARQVRDVLCLAPPG